ncbi:protein O-glucosyltransferase 2-like isoform X2 [Prorops nasuta]|uniref:protein O-glucosyltransferase 2-like isoform X2 n=1 Tax=Prorops nasuta TaxID=863751 RepID=UPI0034CE10C7
MDKSCLTHSPSPGDDIILATIKGKTMNDQPCYVWTQILDCKDGSFIILYKIFNTCYNIQIDIKISQKSVPLFSNIFIGPAYEDECYCPSPKQDWIDHNQCNNHSQINEDLLKFPSVDFNQIRHKIIHKFHQPERISICHYVVKTNKIYKQCYGKYVGFSKFVDSILLSLARKLILPDIEFFVNLGDWPLVEKKEEPYPIFSWCGSSETLDILMPTYDITDSCLESMGGSVRNILTVQSNTDTLWQSKIEKVFWRGRDSRRERLDLIEIARKNPDLFNVSITNFFFFKDEIEKYGPGQGYVSFFHFFKYKYQLNIDGTVAAYRFPYLLAGDSVVFKQDSPYYEHFYKSLKSGEHYISVKRDLSNLVEQIKWAKKHDKEVKKISRTARQFVRDNLLPQHIFCYYAVLFNEWSKRLMSQVKVLDNMEEVKQSEHFCRCHLNHFKDEL